MSSIRTEQSEGRIKSNIRVKVPADPNCDITNAELIRINGMRPVGNARFNAAERERSHVHDPKEPPQNGKHAEPIGEPGPPAAFNVLQCPSTASSGRRLIMFTNGGL